MAARRHLLLVAGVVAAVTLLAGCAPGSRGIIELFGGLLLIVAIGWLAIGGLTAWLAATKNRSASGWFVLGVLIGPLALLAVGLAPAAEPSAEPSSGSLGRWLIADSSSPSLPVGEEVVLSNRDDRLSLQRQISVYGPRVEVASLALSQIEYSVTSTGTTITGGGLTVTLAPGSETSDKALQELLANGTRSAPPQSTGPKEAAALPTGGRQIGELTLLRELADLKNSGVITDEEFEQKKRQILARM